MTLIIEFIFQVEKFCSINSGFWGKYCPKNILSHIIEISLPIVFLFHYFKQTIVDVYNDNFKAIVPRVSVEEILTKNL